MSFEPTDFNISLVHFKEGEYLERHVVCAANRWPDGLIVLGVRHYCPLMHSSLDRMGITERAEEQGFVDQWGNFMTRDEALAVVKMTNQPLRTPYDKWDTLYSENLY